MNPEKRQWPFRHQRGAKQQTKGKTVQDKTLRPVSRQKFGRKLRYFFKEWTSITSNLIILDWIKGCKRPLTNKPIQIKQIKSLKLSATDLRLMSESILKLLSQGSIVQCKHVFDQFLFEIFLADKSNGKKRFILNL